MHNDRTTAKRLIALVGVAAVAVAVGLLAININQQRISNAAVEANDTASFVPPPKNMAELIQRSDLVVIGTTSAILGQGTFGGYDNAGAMIKTGDGSQLPITDYEITVEQVLFSRGDSSAPSPTVLRMIGKLDEAMVSSRDAATYFPMSRLGERRLFFLSRNPDGTYGLFYGPWSRLIVDQPAVTVSNGDKTPFQLEGRRFNTTELLDAIRTSPAR